MGTARAFHCTGRQGRHALAQLHGRVRELLHRSLIATLVLSALLLAPRDACAQLPSAAELASDDDAVRAVAIARLSSLPASALPEITARLAAMRRARPPREQAVEALAAFRHATGSRRADDLADLAQGVPAVLAERRDRDTIRMAEALLLLRSLEAIETTEALALVPEVLRLDGDAWRMEGRRVTLRHGDRIAAASILARAHDDAEGREWARWSSRELGLEPPGRLVQRLAPRELADVLRAWGRTRAMDAMAVVASYVDAEQRMVREAAREALESYGQHALWQSREAFRARLGEDADLAWGWRRTLDELVRRLDSRRFARVDEELAEAREALAAGQLDTAERALAALLAHTPDLAHAGVADALHQLADLRLARGERARADGLYRRALRLAPAGSDVGAIESRLAYLSAESALAGGFVDVDGYERAASLDESCAECATSAAAVRAQDAPPTAERVARVPLLAGAAVLFALLGLGLLFARGRSSGAPPAPPSGEHDPDPHELAEPELADSTLPG